MRTRLFVPKSLMILAAWAAGVAHAQPCTPRWDPSIGQPGFDRTRVSALAVFDDGTGPALYAGGDFVTAGGTVVNRIAKWDGRVWSPLGGGVNTFQWAAVRSLAVYDDGTGPGLYVAGVFTQAGGVRVDNIAKWNGTSWEAVPGVQTSGPLTALAVFDDGTGPGLYVGGFFRVAWGSSERVVNGIARWDGQDWSPLGSGIGGRGGAAGPYIAALCVFDDGEGPALYAGGNFTVAGGVPANSIARWDGKRWWPLAQGITGYPSYVLSMAVHDDGTGPALYVGGGFYYAGGQPASGIARWDGSNWYPVGTENVGVTEAFAVLGDGRERTPRLYADGYFYTGQPGSPDILARWNGSAWSLLGMDGEYTVKAMQVFHDGFVPVLYVGGEFTTVAGAPAGHIAAYRGCVFADLDGDEDVDLADFVIFQQCYAGSGNAPAPTCPAGVDADFDDDGDVDLADFLIFQQHFTGSR